MFLFFRTIFKPRIAVFYTPCCNNNELFKSFKVFSLNSLIAWGHYTTIKLLLPVINNTFAAVILKISCAFSKRGNFLGGGGRNPQESCPPKRRNSEGEQISWGACFHIRLVTVACFNAWKLLILPFWLQITSLMLILSRLKRRYRNQCDQIWYIFYQIRLDALTQHPLFYIIETFRTGGGSPTRSKQLW